MPNALSKLKAVEIGEDNTTWGVYAAPTTGGLFVKEDGQTREELAFLDAAHARNSLYLHQTDRVLGRKGWARPLSFSVPLRSAAFKLLLKQAFGTAGGAGPYVYVKQATNLSTGLCLQEQMGDATNEIRASGGRPKTMKFKVDPSGFLVCDTALVGAVYTTGTVGTLNPPTLHTEPYWRWMRAACKVNGSAAPMSGFELDIDFGLADDDSSCMVLGSQTPGSYPFNGNLQVKGTVNRLFLTDGTAESAFDGYFRAGSAGTVEFTFTAGSDVLYFGIECVFGAPSHSGTGLIMEAIPFECREITTGGGVTELTNGPFSMGITDGV